MSGWYLAGLDAFARGEVAWKATGGSTIVAVLIDLDFYTASLSADTTLADIPALARIAVSPPLVLIDPANGGVLDANDISFTGLSSPPSGETLVLVHDTFVESTSTLLVYIDTATGLPTPVGVPQVNVAWDNGANKIARI
jgi:hypothetical protein